MSLDLITASILQVPHCFSTRNGGVSQGHLASMNLGVHRGDKGKNVIKNYQILGETLGFDVKKLVLTKQVHGEVVRPVTAENWGEGLVIPVPVPCDGLITNVPGTVLAAFTADCVPVLLWDSQTGAVGAIHAGWRGTAMGIAKTAIAQMTASYGSNPAHIRAVIGPCISSCCFETHGEVPAAMTQALGDLAKPAIKALADEKYLVDLKKINEIWLTQAGVAQIEICPQCTACDPDRFFSHRKTGLHRGSLAALITCQP